MSPYVSFQTSLKHTQVTRRSAQLTTELVNHSVSPTDAVASQKDRDELAHKLEPEPPMQSPRQRARARHQVVAVVMVVVVVVVDHQSPPVPQDQHSPLVPQVDPRREPLMAAG